MSWSIRTEGLGKAFTLHLQGGTRIPVLGGVDLVAAAGERLAVVGENGRGKRRKFHKLVHNQIPTWSNPSGARTTGQP